MHGLYTRSVGAHCPSSSELQKCFLFKSASRLALSFSPATAVRTVAQQYTQAVLSTTVKKASHVRDRSSIHTLDKIIGSLLDDLDLSKQSISDHVYDLAHVAGWNPYKSAFI